MGDALFLRMPHAVCGKESVMAVQSVSGGMRRPPADAVLTGPDGFSVGLGRRGASILSLFCPFGDGIFKNIALSFPDPDAPSCRGLYAGALLQPAGRISGGLLPVGGAVHHLSLNEQGRHTLHGGFHSLSFADWSLVEASPSRAVFSASLPDGLDGFPGNRSFRAAYTLVPGRGSSTLLLQLEALSDADTWFDLSSHVYFNLSGNFEEDISGHVLQIAAENVLENAPDFIPSGIAPVSGGPFDFTSPVQIGRAAARDPGNEQLKLNRGYNHAFILDPDRQPGGGLLFASPDGRITLSASSDAPCVVMYSGGFIEEGLPLSDGQLAVPSCACAFEFQNYPDAPGGHGFPYKVTAARETWRREIRWHFAYPAS